MKGDLRLVDCPASLLTIQSCSSFQWSSFPCLGGKIKTLHWEKLFSLQVELIPYIPGSPLFSLVFPSHPLSFTSGLNCRYYLNLLLMFFCSLSQAVTRMWLKPTPVTQPRHFSWALARTSCFLAHLIFSMSSFASWSCHLYHICPKRALLLFLWFVFLPCFHDAFRSKIHSSLTPFVSHFLISFFALSSSRLPAPLICRWAAYLCLFSEPQTEPLKWSFFQIAFSLARVCQMDFLECGCTAESSMSPLI